MEVGAALRIVGGALLAFDCMEGVCTGTKSVTARAVQEDVCLVAAFCKVDLLIADSQIDASDCDSHLSEQLKTVDERLSCTYQLERRRILAGKENVVFYAAAHGWAFIRDYFSVSPQSRCAVGCGVRTSLIRQPRNERRQWPLSWTQSTRSQLHA